MRIKKIHNWAVNSDTKVFKFNNSQAGDTVISEVYIQLPSGVSCSATGYTKEGADEVSLTLLNVGTFATTQSGAGQGIFLIMAGSLEALKLTFTGSGDVIVKEVF